MPRLYIAFLFPKLARARNLYKHIDFALNYISTSIQSKLIFTTIFNLLYLLHVSGCLWFASTTWDVNSVNNWVHSHGILDAGVFSKYIASVYWATVTCTTVGYGDITPTNNIELVLANVLILGGVALFSFLLSNLSSSFADIMSKKQSYQSKLDTLYQLRERFQIDQYYMD